MSMNVLIWLPGIELCVLINIKIHDWKIFTLNPCSTVTYVCLEPMNSPTKHVQRLTRHPVYNEGIGLLD